ncbi:LytTR family two component transcriptional regulator [Flammeovirgaceae bacterium 311]|nr:LytTR family two component transcriptional regulator [Flammeovirgaceae bacterium 311]
MANYINQTPFLELVGHTTNPVEALHLVNTLKVELILLDIQMPELSGIEFLKICGNKYKVILTTAYSEYAVEGFEHDVIDYLLKPISFDRFLKAAHKAQAMMQSREQDANPNSPAAQQAVPAPLSATAQTYMFVKGESKNKFLKVNYSDILFVEGLKNYVSIYSSGQRLVTYQSLAALAEELPQPPFYRVHRSYIISIDKISMIDGNIIYIGDKMIPLGETYRDTFLNMIRDRKKLQ